MTKSITIKIGSAFLLIGVLLIGNVSQVKAQCLTFQDTATYVSCSNADGKAWVYNESGVAPYTFAWSQGATTDTINNIAAGSYAVTVTDANGCTGTATIAVGGEHLRYSFDSIVYPSTCVSSDGLLRINVYSGTPPYTYSWSTGATTNIITGLSAGCYDITVSDACGSSYDAGNECIYGGGNPDFYFDISQRPNNCSNSNGVLAIYVYQGTPPYTYSWSNGATTDTVTGLSSGTYSITVTSACGGTYSSSSSIARLGGYAPYYHDSVINPSNCLINDGAIYINVYSGAPPYTYEWSNGETQNPALGLPAGCYNVTVTDACGSSYDAGNECIYAGGPLYAYDSIANEPSCNVSGEVGISVSGGSTPYTYLWSTGGTYDTIIVFKGNQDYCITITDACGNIYNSCYFIGEAATFSLSQTIFNNSSCDVSAVVTPTGGTPPYTFVWSNNYSTIDTAYGLFTGYNGVTVTDANGCFGYGHVGYVYSTDSYWGSYYTEDINPRCGNSNGAVGVGNFFGGTPPFTFRWEPGGATTDSISGLSAGTYTINIWDNCMEYGYGIITLIQAGPLAVTCTATNLNCGGNDGTVKANVSGGTPPFTYAWSNSATGSKITGLSAGTYSVTVSDSCGNSVTASDTVKQTPPLVVTLTTTNANCGGNNGSILANVTGGTPSYTYVWSNGGTQNPANGLSAGTYTLEVIDQAGCTVTASATITQISAVYVTVNSVTPVFCFGSCNGSAYVTASSGVPPYTYFWSNGNTVDSVTGLCAGIYTVTVTDSSGCTGTATVFITQPPLLTITASVTQNVTCVGGNDGIVTSIAGGGTPPYSYSWAPGGQHTGTISNLTAGSYTVTITDSHGCTATSSATVTTDTTYITVSPSPDTIYVGNSVALAAFGGLSYTWAPPYGLSCTSCAIPIASPSVTTTYTVTGLTACGTFTTTATVVVLPLPCVFNSYSEPICIATIDTSNNKAEVIWGRTNSPPSGGYGHYTVYRYDTTSHLFDSVEGQPLNVLSEFIDTGSNPSAGPVSYELATFDSCGESALSPMHTTIYLTTTYALNVYILSWTAYVGFTPTEYRIFRGPALNAMVQIDSVPNTMFTYHDTLPPINSYYALEAVSPNGPCIPSAHKPDKLGATLSGSFSNGFNTAILGVKNLSNSVSNLNIYPNPNSGIFTLEYSVNIPIAIGSQSSVMQMSVLDELGQVVYDNMETRNAGNYKEQLNLEYLASGIYSLRVQTASGITVKKLVVIKN